MKMKSLLLCLSVITLPVIGLQAGGAELWNKNCKKCHGETGAGDTKIGEKLGIKDYTDPATLADLTDEQLFEMTKNGVPDTKMKGYEKKLSDEEITALVAYMRTLSE